MTIKELKNEILIYYLYICKNPNKSIPYYYKDDNVELYLSGYNDIYQNMVNMNDINDKVAYLIYKPKLQSFLLKTYLPGTNINYHYSKFEYNDEIEYLVLSQIYDILKKDSIDKANREIREKYFNIHFKNEINQVRQEIRERKIKRII